MASHPTPAQPKRAFPSSLPSARRTSTSIIPNSSSATSPSPPKTSLTTSTPTGIPAFRSLRSLLPFGPNKHATTVSATVSPVSSLSRSPFSHFGSVRRSMNRERKASLDVDLPPVISIDRSSRDEIEEAGVRRSVSCSRLEKPLQPDGPQAPNEGRLNPLHDNDGTMTFSTRHAPILRTPSPGPPILADLSTILEADTSGLSKYILSSSDPSRSPSPNALTPFSPPLPPQEDLKPDLDMSDLDLSTTHLTNQVLNAMMAADSNTAMQWLTADKAVIVDGEDTGTDPNASFNLGALDADLAALLSPHRLPATKSTNSNIKSLTIDSQRSSQSRPPIDLSKLSPASPQFNLSPASSNPIFTTSHYPVSAGTSTSGSLRSRLPRQQSSLPRLRPPLPPSPCSPHSPTPSTVLPSSSASDSTGPGDDDTARMGLPHANLQRRTSPSPLTASASASASASAPASPAGATFSKTALKPNPPSSPTMSTSTSPPILSRRFTPRSTTVKTPNRITPATSTTGPSPPPSTLSRLKAPFTQITSTTQRPDHLQVVSSLGNDSDPRPSPSPSPSRLGPRPSLDTTTRGSGSFDRPPQSSLSPVPPGHQIGYETPARPSLDTLRGADSGSGTGGKASVVLSRTRKRSMSVQERFGRHLLGGSRRHGFGGDGDHERENEGVRGEFGELRPSSSMSGRLRRRWEGGTDSGGGGSIAGSGIGRAPITEWLGPRTVKAFRAAGLIDFERDQQEQSPGGIPGLSSSAGPGALGRFASMRSTSEYNPRAPSRMAFSEAGGSSVSRRGSVSGTGVGMAYGLMESPTFTASSGSRDRDTPRSASTAPTSVSGSSFAFLGRDRDRDRDRDREEIKELREKHATETEALLGALSDSQRTTRVLREENGELRERLEQVETENDALRKVVVDLTKEGGDLRVQVQMLKASKSTSSRLGTGTWSVPVRRSGLSTPIHIDSDDEDDCRRGGSVKQNGEREHNWLGLPPEGTRKSSNQDGRDTDDFQGLDGDHLEPQPIGPAFSSTPAVAKHRRRYSTTSSIFPVPPANMTMLLHDNDHSDSISFNGSLDHSKFSPPPPAPLSIGRKRSVNGHSHNTSVASTTSISPTTANFSMTTGSPGSLFLRPEHEMHLGDMDSLDLGVKRDVNIAVDDDGWSA